MRHPGSTQSERRTDSAQGPAAREESFDWWAAPPVRGARPRPPAATTAPPQATAEPAPATAPPQATAEPAPATAPGPAAEPPEAGEPAEAGEPGEPASRGVYRSVQQSDEFREIRARYRRFVFPATAAFLGWYLLYVVAAVAAPRLMNRHVVGPLSVAWLFGLLQYASTFLLAWLYSRHARVTRDRAALGLRWDTQDRLR